MSREVTKKLLEMIDEGLLDANTVVHACLKYMGEDEVADMAEANEFIEEEPTADYLPTNTAIDKSALDDDWDILDDEEKEELISDYLSDTFGFCHAGYDYVDAEDDDVVYITNIKWDICE